MPLPTLHFRKACRVRRLVARDSERDRERKKGRGREKERERERKGEAERESARENRFSSGRDGGRIFACLLVYDTCVSPYRSDSPKISQVHDLDFTAAHLSP